MDIIAVKKGQKYAIQCKNYASPLGNKPIQEVYTGKTFYKCDIAVVMTNSIFTQSAQILAESTGVVLWDRDILSAMVTDSLRNPFPVFK